MKVTLLVPTMNEVECVKKVMPLVNRKWVDQILILDGKSTDGTVEWCKEQGYEVFVQKKHGMWNAYREVYNSGKIRGNVVITFSPDGNSLPEAIPELMAMMNEGYDMVIGSRYYNGMKSPDDTKLTRFGNWLFTSMCNFAGYKYTDALVMLRAYDVKTCVWNLGFLDKPNWLQKKLIKLSNLYGWESSMSIRAAKKHLKIGEIYELEPKAYRERRQNTLVHGFVIGTQILHELLR